MSELVTCAHCGATNPPDAEWCGQCFGSLGSRPEDSEPESPATDGAATVQAPARSGWECRACQTVNDVDRSECSLCGLSIYDSYGAETERAAFDPETALRRSIIFPTEIIVGVVLSVALAAILDLALLWLGRAVTPWAEKGIS